MGGHAAQDAGRALGDVEVVAESLVMVLDDGMRAHLASALAEHAAPLRRNGLRPPDALTSRVLRHQDVEARDQARFEEPGGLRDAKGAMYAQQHRCRRWFVGDSASQSTILSTTCVASLTTWNASSVPKGGCGVRLWRSGRG